MSVCDVMDFIHWKNAQPDIYTFNYKKLIAQFNTLLFRVLIIYCR